MAANQAPPADHEHSVLGFIREAVEEGEAFLKAQRGYNRISKSMDMVLGETDDLPSTLSRTSCNMVGKVASDLASLMTDWKPFWEYRTANRRFDRHAQIYSKRATVWYTSRYIDRRMADAIRYWTVAGTGWTHQYYNPDTDDLDCAADDPRDVLPIRPLGNETIQTAFGVVRRYERTVNYLRRRYPHKAHLITATRDGSAASLREQTRTQRLLDDIASPFQAALGRGPARTMPRVPAADVFETYVDDQSRNETGSPVLMGEFGDDGRPHNNWSYVVPPGERLYPRKRLIVATDNASLYDGPSPYWHGLYPVSKLTLDPWPWSWFGKAPLWDLLAMQGTLNRLLRAVDDHNAKVAQPDVVADKNAISRAKLETINTRRPGGKHLVNALAGKLAFQIVPPPQLDPNIYKTIEFIIDRMEVLSGVRDMSQLMRLNQMPSGDTIEKLIEGMTPAVRGRSRALEAFMREFAMIALYNFAQFDSLPLRLQMLGPDGVTPEDFELYDPQTLVPDFLGDDMDERGIPTQDALLRGPLPRFDRAREFLRQFTFYVAPGSLLSASEIERKLLYLQLSRAGLVDHWTLLEVLGIQNAGEPPDNARTITERLLAEQQMGLGMNISPAGRKASGQSMPRLVTKES